MIVIPFLIYFADHIKGTEIVASKRVYITANRPSFQWKENGFTIHAPDGSLPDNTSDLALDIGVSLSGQFELPPECQLVSVVYWIRRCSSVKLKSPVIVDIEHCVSLTDPSQCSQLSFVITHCNQRVLPYKFELLEGGVFTVNSSYGSINRLHFSGLGIVRQFGGRHPPVDERYCLKQLLYRHSERSWKFVFAAVKDLAPLLNVSKSL